MNFLNEIKFINTEIESGRKIHKIQWNGIATTVCKAFSKGRTESRISHIK